MTTSSSHQKIVDLEKAYWDAIKSGDVATIERLTDDECIITGAQGAASLRRDQIVAMWNEGSTIFILNSYRIDPATITVRQIGDDVALIAYKVREDLTVKGQPVQFDASDSSVWVRRGGSWTCALHTESIAGDPFGRK